MTKPFLMVARVMLGLIVLMANALACMWLGRLQLAGFILQQALAQQGLQAKVQVTELDKSHIHLAHMDLPGNSQLHDMDVGYSLAGLRHQELGDISLSGGALSVQQDEDGWKLGGVNLSALMNNDKESGGWKTGALNLRNMELAARGPGWSFAGTARLRQNPDGALQINAWRASGAYAMAQESVRFSDAALDAQIRKASISANLAGQVQLSRAKPDEGWAVRSGSLHVIADLQDGKNGWQGPVRLNSQLSGIGHPAVTARNMEVKGTGDITIANAKVTDFDGAIVLHGKGVDLSRFGLVRQVEFQSDMDALLQPVVAQLDAAQRDLQITLFSSVYFHEGQVSVGQNPAQITMEGQKSRLTTQFTSARYALSDGAFAAEGAAGLQMKGLGWGHVRHFQASGTADDLDIQTNDAEAQIATAGRKLVISSTQGRMVRRPSRLYWSGLAKLQWNGQFLHSRITDAVMSGRIGLDLQPGETRLSLLQGPANVQAKAMQVGDWQGTNLSAQIMPVDNASVLHMHQQGNMVQAAFPQLSGMVRKADMSGFSVTGDGAGMRAKLQFPAGQPATANISLHNLELRLSGEQKPHIVVQKAEIHAKHDLGQWQGNADVQSVELTTQDMPVTVISGHPELQFTLDKTGLNMTGDKVEARLTPLPDYAPLLPVTVLRMNVQMGDGEVNGTGRSFLANSSQSLGTVHFTHDLASGAGSFTAENAALIFRPGGLQPRQLLPSLAGLVANVTGRTSYAFHGDWSPQGLQETGGDIASQGVNFDLLLGRVEGVSGEIQFSSLLPLRTAAPAKIHVAVLDPGVELQDGEVVLAFNRDGEIDIERAHWPFAGGEFFLQPMHWVVGGTDQKALLNVHNVDLLELSGLLGLQHMSAKGRLSGGIPLHMANNTLYVERARLSAAPPGVLQYSGSVGDHASKAAPQAKLAFDALKDLHYEQLELSLDGDVAGRMQAKLTLLGHNPDVLDGAPFLLRINTSAEFARLVRQATQGGRIAETISTTLERAQKNNKANGQNQP